MVKLPGFNSMKVRLKPEVATLTHSDKNLFQFHEGPIKTGAADKALAEGDSFNSMKVRLKLCVCNR